MYRPPLHIDESFYGYMGRISRHIMLPISRIKNQFFGENKFKISQLLPMRPVKIVEGGIFSKEEMEDIVQHNTLPEYLESFPSIGDPNVIRAALWTNDNIPCVFENEHRFYGHENHHRIPKHINWIIEE